MVKIYFDQPGSLNFPFLAFCMEINVKGLLPTSKTLFVKTTCRARHSRLENLKIPIGLKLQFSLYNHSLLYSDIGAGTPQHLNRLTPPSG